ncbi:tetratricopeptide repeat protein [Arthrobacter sp. JSM 101049]|uniref:tetratricopeptide repeat protein n=1 Tax=Arthrobacter sp. JSM 101049 TaxID=929097 RepID=UPI0035695F13
MTTPIDWIPTGIPGLSIHPDTLLAQVVDDDAAHAALAGANPVEQVMIHVARGDVATAAELVTETRLLDPQNFPMRVVDADVVRASGDPERAIKRLRSLIDEFKDTEHEAVLQQQLGVLYFTVGDYHAAVTRFRTALELRTAAADEAFRIEISRRSLAAAQAKATAVR